MTSANQSDTRNPDVIAILGASRGFGACLVQRYSADGRLLRLARHSSMDFRADFSQENQWSDILEYLSSQHVRRVFYCAGGGPYGPFLPATSKWHAQEWAHRVSFLFPAYLIHHGFHTVEQMIFVGSSVAENAADPGAAMYCASKHALKGLIETVQSELKGKENGRDLRLFSPGYMNTDLLPQKSWPRLNPPAGMQIHQPMEVAQRFREFAESAEFVNQNLVMEHFQRLPRPS